LSLRFNASKVPGKVRRIYPCNIHPLKDKIFAMEENRLLQELEEIAEKLSITVH